MAFTSDQGVHYTDGAQLDAAGKLRVSSPTIALFQNKLNIDDRAMFWDDVQVSGSGTSSTHSAFRASQTLAVSNVTAGRRVRQTRSRFVYQAGKSQVIKRTLIMGVGAVGITKRHGFFDDNNGIFLERKDNAINFVVRSNSSGSPSDANSVAQASWNLDTLDGSGNSGNPSGITLDLTKAQLMIIDFVWQGVSPVRVGFVISGHIYYVHQFLTANSVNVVFMSNPNLPLRTEIINSGAGPAATIEVICDAVDSESGTPIPGFHSSADTGSTPLVTLNNSNLYPIIAIRINPAKLDGFLQAHHLGIMCTTNAQYRYAVLLNPTVVGTALSFSDANPDSIVQVARPTNATTVTGGHQCTSGYSPTGANTPQVAEEVSDIPLGSTIAGVPDVLVLAVQRLSGTTESFLGFFHWIEVV